MLEVNTDIDLIILDFNMSEANDFQILVTLQSDERYKKMRTIILTKYDEPENEIKGLRLGAVDYIRKPVHPESLKARIKIHIELLRTQQQLEGELYKHELEFSAIFQQAPLGIAISDAKSFPLLTAVILLL